MNAAIVDPMPTRNKVGKRNMDLFLLGTKSSPVCFYFEDEGSEELYKRFLKRLFPKYIDPLVVCTGGKTKKKALQDADEHKLSPVVYIQDKDFDDLIGTLPGDPRIVTLNRYSFENYLIDSDALTELAIESKRRLKREEAIKTLSLEDYFLNLYESYRPLGSLFVISRRLNLKGIKTTKQDVSDILLQRLDLVSVDDLCRFENEVTSVAIRSQRISMPEQIKEMINSALDPKVEYIDHADEHPNAHLCGKHLLDMVLSYIDGKVGTSLGEVDRFEISMRLVSHISVSLFERVREAIFISLSNQNTSEDVMVKFK